MNVPSLVTIAPALDASKYVQGAAQMERANETIADSTERVDRSQTQMAAKMGMSAGSVDRLQSSLDKTFAAQLKHQRLVERITEVHERGRITDQRRIELLDLAQQRYQRATGATQQFGAAQERATGSSRQFGFVAQQAGFQVQDFFVQVASGQSAFVALAQQAPQFLGIFGAAGALAGAAVAIGAVGLQFLGLGKNTETAAEATNHFGAVLDAITPRLTAQGAELNTLAGRYTALAREIGQAAELVARADISARMQVIAQQRAAMAQAAESFGLSPGLLARNPDDPEQYAAPRLLRRMGIRENAAEIERATQALRAAQQFQVTGDVRAFAEALDALGGRYRQLAEDQAATLTNYIRETQAIDMLLAQIAVLQGTATEEQRRLAAAGQGINTLVDQRRAQQRAAEEVAALERQVAESIQATINSLDPASAATQRYEEQYRLLRLALEQGVISQQRYNELIGTAIDAHRRAIDPMIAYNEQLDRQARALRAQIDPQEAYRQRLEELNVLLYAGKISSEEYGAAAEQAFARINGAAQTGRRLSDELGFAFSSAFEEAIVRGQSLRNVLAGIASDLAKIVLRRGVTGPLANALDPLLSNLGGSVANFFGFGAPQVGAALGPVNLGLPGFGGALADGGPARAGVPYLVGEEGPELFVPRQSGTVLPNGTAIGGRQTIINQTIQISTGVAQTVRAEVLALMPRIRSETVAAVADARQRGGSFAAAMGT